MDADKLSDELKEEYKLLQAQYEAFDARALTIKSWSGPLLAGSVGIGLWNSSTAVIFAAILAALCLWALEGIWKSFQYCYTDRIKLIERWFRENRSAELVPFQIFTAWGEVWHRHFKHPKNLLPILSQRFVYLPYLPIIAFGAVALLYAAVRDLMQ
jgi:hypothetical protein